MRKILNNNDIYAPQVQSHLYDILRIDEVDEKSIHIQIHLYVLFPRC